MLLASLACSLLVPQSTEGWSVVSLQPPGVPVFSQPYAAVSVHSGLQGGYTWNGNFTPGYWQGGDATSWQSLGSYATDTFLEGHWGTDFVGFQSFTISFGNFFETALLWRVGAGVEEVSLHPASAFSSRAQAIHDSQQGGFVEFTAGQTRACTWSGTAGSLTDLHPAGASASAIEGMGLGSQVGYATFGEERAGLWSGSAGSFIDLHPVALGGIATLGSRALQTDGEGQVGYALLTGGSNLLHPMLWTGSLASAIDLLPTGFTTGQASGVFDGRQVGYARTGGVSSAVIWNGSAESYIQLGNLLPPDGAGYSGSLAYDVWNDGTTWYVIGEAFVTSKGSKPVLWSSPMVAAQEVVRLGTPPNPNALQPGVTSGPILGQTWDPRVDHGSFIPNSALDLLLISQTELNLPIPGAGTLLCQPGEFPIEIAAPGASFAVTVPDDFALAGAEVFTQGLSLDPAGQLHGTNALDLVVGEIKER